MNPRAGSVRSGFLFFETFKSSLPNRILQTPVVPFRLYNSPERACNPRTASARLAKVFSDAFPPSRTHADVCFRVAGMLGIVVEMTAPCLNTFGLSYGRDAFYQIGRSNFRMYVLLGMLTCVCEFSEYLQNVVEWSTINIHQATALSTRN